MTAMPRPLVVLLVAALASFAAPGCSRAPQRNVVLIVIDTLRADALGVYGQAQPLSPAIDALAASGQVFENHISHGSQTVPATLSLHLSQLPAEHGFSHRSIQHFLDTRPVYPDRFTFLAEVFRDAGRATAGFVANPYLGAENGFDQGFETFSSTQGDGAAITGSAVRWLEQWSTKRERPFFLYLHTMDVHQPYQPPAPERARFAPGEARIQLSGNRRLPFVDPGDLAYTRALYTACVAHADAQVGELVRRLDELRLREDTIVVLTADHGEEFGEHGGVGHGTTVYGELVRVPLVISAPGVLEPGRRIDHLSQHVDLAPTILRLAGVSVPGAFRGTSVLEPAERVFVENFSLRGVYRDGRKLIWNRDTGERQLFDLRDALDAKPLEEPEVAQRLAADLEAYAQLESAPRGGEPAPAAAPAWSPEEIERLRALGYAE